MTTEEEQIQIIKDFWKRYGHRILTVTTVLLLVFAGWNFWQKHQLQMTLQASQTYDQLLHAYDQEGAAARESRAKYLVSHYAKTPYAAMAGLLLAHHAVQQGQFDDALQYLHQVIDKAKMPAVRQIARNRAARLYLAKGEYKVALKTLNKVEDEAYKPVIAAIRGDIYVAQKHFDKARVAYQEAIQLLPFPGAFPLVEMKLKDLTADSGQAAEQTT